MWKRIKARWTRDRRIEVYSKRLMAHNQVLDRMPRGDSPESRGSRLYHEDCIRHLERFINTELCPDKNNMWYNKEEGKA